MNANDYVDINPALTLDQNTQLNGVPTLGQLIGQLDEMTLRSGKTYPTPGLFGGDLSPTAKVIAITLIAAVLSTGALYLTYLTYASSMCAVSTTPHVTGAAAGVDLGCTLARQALVSAIKKMAAIGLIVISTTYGVAHRIYLTPTGVTNINNIITFIMDALQGRLTLEQIRAGPTNLVPDNPALAQSTASQIPAAQQPQVQLLQKADPSLHAGSSRRRPNYKKQRRSRQKKNSGKKQYRKSRQLY